MVLSNLPLMARDRLRTRQTLARGRRIEMAPAAVSRVTLSQHPGAWFAAPSEDRLTGR
jgi:hypothetical protein